MPDPEMPDEVTLSRAQAEELAMRACLAAGADSASARSLVDATLSAALHGSPAVGFPHFVDYLSAFRAGRIKRQPKPALSRPFPAFLASDADGGIAQLGFDLAFGDLLETVRRLGMAVFSQKNSFTTGELGYYVRRLAEQGIVSLAATNAHALMVPEAGRPTVYSTNPLAFGFPLGDGSAPLVIDQSTSATAFVNIVRAAGEGRTIPEGWAVDRRGAATTDAAEALAGALLPFGGRKGANLALLVEMMSAGLSGGAWSLDAADFRSGTTSPAVGLTVIAIMPGSAADGLIGRAREQVRRLRSKDVYVPGVSRERASQPLLNELTMPRSVFEALSKFTGE